MRERAHRPLLIVVLIALSSAGAPARGQDAPLGSAEGALPHLGDGWQTAARAAVEVHASRLKDLTQSIEAGDYGNVHAVLVERDGLLVYEEYFAGEDETWGEDLGRVAFGRASLHDLRSVSKSVVSALVGIAIDRSEIPPVDTPLAALLPDYTHVLSGEKLEIRLWHVLSMSAGLRWDEWSLPYAHPENDWQRLTKAADPVAFLLDLTSSP